MSDKPTFEESFEAARWDRTPYSQIRSFGNGVILGLTGDVLTVLYAGYQQDERQRKVEAAVWGLLEIMEGERNNEGIAVDVQPYVDRLKDAMPAFVNPDYNHCDVCEAVYHSCFHEACPYCGEIPE